MLKILLLLLPLLVFADDDDRKMTPEEMEQYRISQLTQRQIEEIVPQRTIYPDIMPMPFGLININLVRFNDNYNSYLSMISTVYDICEYICQNGFNTAFRLLREVNESPNRHPTSGLSLAIANDHTTDAVAYVAYESDWAFRASNNQNSLGTYSIMRLGNIMYAMDIQTASATFAHELGHSFRGHIGHSNNANMGFWLTVGGHEWQRSNWWLEELENSGLAHSRYPWATENAYRNEARLDPRPNYAGLTIDLFYNAEMSHEYYSLIGEAGLIYLGDNVYIYID